MTQGNKIIKNKNIVVITIVSTPTSFIFREITMCRLCPNWGYQKNMLINSKKKKNFCKFRCSRSWKLFEFAICKWCKIANVVNRNNHAIQPKTL